MFCRALASRREDIVWDIGGVHSRRCHLIGW